MPQKIHGSWCRFRVSGSGFRVRNPELGTRNSKLFVVALIALLAACHGGERHGAQAPSLPELARPLHVAPARNGTALLSVPDDLVVPRGGLPGVFALRDGRARFQPVKLGKRAGGTVEVLAGLGGGEKLVGGKLADVRDGSPIKAEPR
jgi:hypothetical protein